LLDRPRREHQPAALGGKRPGGGEADPVARTGDKHDFARELEVHRRSPFISPRNNAGRKVPLTPGSSYQVADNDGAHRSFTETGPRLFIVD
jgi:hypothetical protein